MYFSRQSLRWGHGERRRSRRCTEHTHGNACRSGGVLVDSDGGHYQQAYRSGAQPRRLCVDPLHLLMQSHASPSLLPWTACKETACSPTQPSKACSLVCPRAWGALTGALFINSYAPTEGRILLPLIAPSHHRQSHFIQGPKGTYLCIWP